MVLYSIPDIRLFWSEDPRFHSQFTKKRSTNIPPKTLANLGSHREMNVFKFQPFSKYPACYKDISFWCGTASTNQEDGRRQVETVIHDNDFCDLVREVAGDLAEEVHLVSLKRLCFP